MKEFIATETSKDDAEEGKKFYPLRQQDINLGAGLMLLGVLKAILAAMASPGSRDHEIAVLLFVLGLVFGAAIMFSQLSPRQRGLTVGATIVFVGSLLGLIAGLAGGAAPGMFFGLSISLAISLFWTKLARVFMRIFFDKDVAPEKKLSSTSHPGLNPAAASAPALPPVQDTLDVEPTTNRMKEPEIAMPVSVTENTTRTLNNKKSFTES